MFLRGSFELKIFCIFGQFSVFIIFTNICMYLGQMQRKCQNSIYFEKYSKPCWPVCRVFFATPQKKNNAIQGVQEELCWLIVCYPSPDNGLHSIRPKEGRQYSAISREQPVPANPKVKIYKRKQESKKKECFLFLGRFLGGERVFFLFFLTVIVFSSSLSWSRACFLSSFIFLDLTFFLTIVVFS